MSTPQAISQKYQLLTRCHDRSHQEAQFNAAIDFAVSEPCEAASFLSLWREGDWHSIASGFPDFTPPVPDDNEILSAEALAECYGDGEYEAYPSDEWAQAVASGATRAGYWTWVREQMVAESDLTDTVGEPDAYLQEWAEEQIAMETVKSGSFALEVIESTDRDEKNRPSLKVVDRHGGARQSRETQNSAGPSM